MEVTIYDWQIWTFYSGHGALGAVDHHAGYRAGGGGASASGSGHSGDRRQAEVSTGSGGSGETRRSREADRGDHLAFAIGDGGGCRAADFGSGGVPNAGMDSGADFFDEPSEARR